MYALVWQGITSVPTPSGVFTTEELEIMEGAASGDYNLELTSGDFTDEKFEDIPDIGMVHAAVSINQ